MPISAPKNSGWILAGWAFSLKRKGESPDVAAKRLSPVLTRNGDVNQRLGMRCYARPNDHQNSTTCNEPLLSCGWIYCEVVSSWPKLSSVS